jgi:hypothetical protein
MTTLVITAFMLQRASHNHARRNQMTANPASSGVATAPGGVSVPINVEVITQPVADTSMRMYRAATDGLQWYCEQWEDLFLEARHMGLGANAHLTAAAILPVFAHAKVVSDLPGRLRIRVKELRWQDDLVAQCTQAIGSLPGMKQVSASSVTGSILMLYDTAQYGSCADLLNAIAAA